MKWKWSRKLRGVLNELVIHYSNSHERILEWITENSLLSIISYCFIIFKYSKKEWHVVRGDMIEYKKPSQNQRIIYTRRGNLGFIIHFTCDDEEWPIALPVIIW